jgi:hypothetical protein
MSLLYPSNMPFQLLFTTMYPCKYTNNITLTDCKLLDHRNTLQLIAAGSSLNWTHRLAVTHSVLTYCELYNHQDIALCFVIIFLNFPQQQVKAPQTPQPGPIGSRWSWMAGASSSAPPGATQMQCRHQEVRYNTAIVTTENMTHHANLKMLCKIKSRMNKKQLMIGCE